MGFLSVDNLCSGAPHRQATMFLELRCSSRLHPVLPPPLLISHVLILHQVFLPTLLSLCSLHICYFPELTSWISNSILMFASREPNL